MNKKKSLLIVGVVVLIAVVALSFIIYRQFDHAAKHIVIDGVEYRRDITQLDLSGKTVTELEKLYELTGLQTLNLRDTGITVQQYELLHAALPECRILWSVPFQDGYCSNDTDTLAVTELAESDFAALEYLPGLKAIHADGCRNYDVIQKLMAAYPNLEVSYTVSISGTDYPRTQTSLEVTDPDAGELMANLQYLPQMQSVVLDGTLPDGDTLLALRQAYPEIIFDYDFEAFGMTLNSLDEMLDLTGIPVESTDQVHAIMPHFYHLTHVEMVNCGVSNEDMDALNRSYENTKFVWTVKVSGVTLRTDITYFMPWQHNLEVLGSCYNLRYCTDLQVLDVGHKALYDFTFVEYLPNLWFLGMCQDPVSDISVVANCTSLKVLEIFLTNVSDFWPLTNLTNLEDLNISFTPCMKYGHWSDFGDITPLYEMTWLDRLWMTRSGLSTAEQDSLLEALPGTVILFYSDGSTNRGWRQSPNYYEQRDLMGMWYMIH